jgi:NADH-quinone oxidoreductase subunit N
MLDNLIPLLPEIYLAGLVLATLIVGMFSKEETAFKNSFVVALSGLFGVFAILLVSIPQNGMVLSVFPLAKNSVESLFLTHEIMSLTKLLIVLCGIVLLIISKPYLQNRQLLKFEYNVLFLAAILGSFIALSSINLIIIFIGLELLSFSTYALVGFNRRSTKAVKSANKYFIVGSVSSSLMLYGISLFYVTMGSVSYDVMALKIQDFGFESLGFENYLSIVLISSGLFFKIAIVPLQFYLRDVLYAANRPMLGFISTITKVVGLMVLFQMFVVILPDEIPSLYYNLLLSFAAITIFIGSVTALRENNINRLLAYSSINNAGFMLIAATLLNFEVTAIYVFNYCLVILAIVCFVLSIKVRGEYIKNIKDLVFVAKHDHRFAVVGIILIFTLAGIPPFILFYAKFLVVQELIKTGFIGWAVMVVVFSIFAVAYCLRIIKFIYFKQTEDDVSIQTIKSTKIMTYFLFLVIVLFSILPDTLFRLI